MVTRRLLSYVRPHKMSLAFALSLLLLATAADVMGPILIKIFIDDYLTPANLQWKPIITLAITFLILHITAVVLRYYQLVSFHKIALKIVQQLRIDVFSRVQHLGLAFFDNTQAGATVSRITNDTEAIKELFVSVLSTFLQNIVFLSGILVAMFFLNKELAVFCLVLLPAIIFLMQAYRRLSTKIYRVLREKLGQLNATLSETIQGMNIIQAMHQEPRFRAKFAAINQDYYHSSLKNIKLSGLLVRPAVDLLYLGALALVLGFFGRESIAGYVEIGVLYAFINYLDRFFEPVNAMMMRLSQLQQALVAGGRVFELMDDTRTAPVKKAAERPLIKEGLIKFNNVSFSYDGKTEVLKDISFAAYPGQTVALVGHTGSGKSTIINLLMRFYPVSKGEITIDGVPLDFYEEWEIRHKIGLVLQDPFLFAGDIKQNIRLHNPSISEADIAEAAKFVQADSFIQKLPHKYEQPLGERGVTLSSGQRQLLSFARTMAIKPKILVLDEATSSVDSETEDLIQTSLKKMRQGRTTIAIAHRLSTVQDADLILVLHRGRIVERGNHRELLEKKGLYHKMFLIQQGVKAAG